MNPLASHFRQPVIYTTLPSAGKWWPEGAIAIPAGGELPVLSMTAIDEILLRTPDMLFNGEATVRLIEHCMPNIKNAWQLPTVDLESILIAIRIASVGEKIQLEITCPNCTEDNNYDIDLKNQIDNFDCTIWKKQITIQDLTIDFAPLSYRTQCDYDQKVYQCQKQSAQLSDVIDTNERDHLANQIINQMNILEVEYVASMISKISILVSTTPYPTRDIVTEPEFIKEFIFNCEKKVFSQIKFHTDMLKQSNKCTNLKIHCPDCAHDFETAFGMDYASFFELSS